MISRTARTAPIFFPLVCLLAACTGAPEVNPTVFPYEIDAERLSQRPLDRVVIAHVNLGGPSRNYLQVHEKRLDKLVENYLEEQGIEVLPQRLFEQHWKTAVRMYGNTYDPTTGDVNQRAFARVLIQVRDELLKARPFDAIVFTDILEQEVPFSGGLKHLARWHGVSRKPTLQGPGDGVSANHDWNRPAKVASLWVSIYDVELQRLFTSVGGLDTTEAIDTRSSSGRFVRRRSILENRAHLREGIELAFHPFIEMEAYPGPR